MELELDEKQMPVPMPSNEESVAKMLRLLEEQAEIIVQIKKSIGRLERCVSSESYKDLS